MINMPMFEFKKSGFWFREVSQNLETGRMNWKTVERTTKMRAYAIDEKQKQYSKQLFFIGND